MKSIRGKTPRPMEVYMTYDVLCIGNAIVDLISRVDEDFVTANGFDKGGMMLVDADESGRRIALVPDLAMSPGGSVANTAACLASLGSKVGFIGKVGNDPLGAFFKEGMQSLGVDFLCADDHSDIATASCLAVVTPDGERTMSTYLGACVHLNADDVPEEAVANAEIVFIEGYLLDSPSSYAAVRKVFDIAGKHGTKIALTLSDAGCVDRHNVRFFQLASHPDCHVVIANEREITALYGTSTTDGAIKDTQWRPYTSVITLGSKGAVAVGNHAVERVSAAPVERIVDLVGAGDAFAAGFLHAYVRGEDNWDALGVGAKCAAVVIQGQGARPSVNLKDAVYGHVDNTKVFA